MSTDTNRRHKIALWTSRAMRPRKSSVSAWLQRADVSFVRWPMSFEICAGGTRETQRDIECYQSSSVFLQFDGFAKNYKYWLFNYRRIIRLITPHLDDYTASGWLHHVSETLNSETWCISMITPRLGDYTASAWLHRISIITSRFMITQRLDCYTTSRWLHHGSVSTP